MPGYLGGGGSSGGTGGEIRFPKEFVDPVTKLRVSNPENLIDTDFEYGLQPTKWETVELINNTPSFFSKSGDTTIDNILSITTNQGTREIIVRTSQEHLLAVGIPINVQGSKSLTADGAYIINSIPDPFTFTYLCKDTQTETAAINDLYTSIITGEFFQGSQLRISDDNGIVTNGAGLSVLTVTTDSTHGFGINTPFYFLNLNSAIAQEFQAANTASKSFDASNSATAQTFDGSNTLSSINIDFSNSGVAGGTVSNIQSVNTIDETITVTHTTETFENLALGTPLYYNVTAGSGFFLANPRGVVFLKTTGSLGSTSSTFQVSETPDGPPIDLQGAMTGTFQISNQSRTFAGNNRNPETEITLSVLKEDEIVFDGGNQGYDGDADSETAPNGSCTVLGYTGDSILVSTPSALDLDYYVGTMVRYTTSGAAATNLVNNTTYFINSVTASATPGLYTLTIKELPDSETILNPTGGSGTQEFEKIGVSIDKDIIHVRNANFAELDMLEYSSFPENGRFTSEESAKNFYFVTKVFDSHNFQINDSAYSPTTATGGTITQVNDLGRLFNIHTFTTTGNSTFEVTSVGTDTTVEFLVVAGGGGGGMDMGGGGGGGGMIEGTFTAQAGTYSVSVGGGGRGAPRAGASGQPGAHVYTQTAFNGEDTTVTGPGSLLLRAKGGGAGGMSVFTHSSTRSVGAPGGSGGGTSGYANNSTFRNGGIATQSSQGAATGTLTATMYGNRGGRGGRQYYSGGGGGAGGIGTDSQSRANGGPGRPNSILGTEYYWAGGGGGSGYSITGGDGGIGGGGGAAIGTTVGGGSALNPGLPGGGGGTNANANRPGGAAGANTGGGGGGGSHFQGNNGGGAGGSGIVIFRYPITPFNPNAEPMFASGGTVSQITLTRSDGVELDYNVHAFTTTGTTSFTVSDAGQLGGQVEYLVVGGGGGGGADMGGGGGGGGVLEGTAILEPGEYPIVVGAGGLSSNQPYSQRNVNSRGQRGQDSSAFSVTALGGGGGAGIHDNNNAPAGPVNGASGGGSSGRNNNFGNGTLGQGFRGGSTGGSWYAGGGGGASQPGSNGTGGGAFGGDGKPSSILGTEYWFGGGGGASGYSSSAGRGGKGGGGGGARWSSGSNGAGDTNGINPAGSGTGSTTSGHGGSGGENTGGGAGGHAHQAANNTRRGGSGIVVVRYLVAVRAGEEN